ncbi:hypothetical protein [Salmonella phage SD-12_S18]|nr:hypothetical protein [Salmonella phage SD-12_S18]
MTGLSRFDTAYNTRYEIPVNTFLTKFLYRVSTSMLGHPKSFIAGKMFIAV